MDDAELVKLLRNMDEYEPLGHDGWKAAARIEALIAERDRFAERHERHLVLGAEVRARAEKAEAERDAARDAALEEAARIAETLGVHPQLNVWGGGPDWFKHGKNIAAAIRALKGKSHE